MNEETQKKAVIYCRVSTKEQVEEGNSLASQERNCREYAIKYNYDIVMQFIEEGESAKTADRTELQKLLKFCSEKKNQIKAIIIYKIDRLSRNTDDYSQLRILLKRFGIEIKSTSEYFENTPAGRFMENIIANVAQFDNDVRAERCVGGLKEAMRNGRYVWTAPVGYKNEKVDGKSTIVQSDKACYVHAAFQMLADRQYSVELVRKKLAANGVQVCRAQFYKMLRNEVYAGWICKFDERHKGLFTPIVSEELFNRVQLVLGGKKSPAVYRQIHPDFPLRKFILTSNNEKLTGSWSKGRYKKYAYYRFIRMGLEWPKNSLEKEFRTFMNKYAFDEKSIVKLKNAVFRKFSDKSSNQAKEMDALIQKKKELKNLQNTLIHKNVKGVISDELLKEQLSIIDDQKWEMDNVLNQQEERKIDINTTWKYIEEFLLYPATIWEKVPLETRIKLQWFQFPNGLVFDGKKFRTGKISSIFKLKKHFDTAISPKVDPARQHFEHHKQANTSPLSDEKPFRWKDIQVELLNLSAILKSTDESPPIESLPILCK